MQTQTQACHAIDSEFVSIYQHPSTTGKLRKKQLIIAATVAALCRTPKQSTHNYITKKNTHVAARLCGAPIYYSALPCHALLSRTCVLFPAIRALRFSRVHRHHHSRSPPCQFTIADPHHPRVSRPASSEDQSSYSTSIHRRYTSAPRHSFHPPPRTTSILAIFQPHRILQRPTIKATTPTGHLPTHPRAFNLIDIRDFPPFFSFVFCPSSFGTIPFILCVNW